MLLPPWWYIECHCWQATGFCKNTLYRYDLSTVNVKWNFYCATKLLGLWHASPAAISQNPNQRANRNRTGQRASGSEFADRWCHISQSVYRYQLHRLGATIKLSHITRHASRVAFGAKGAEARWTLNIERSRTSWDWWETMQEKERKEKGRRKSGREKNDKQVSLYWSNQLQL